MKIKITSILFAVLLFSACRKSNYIDLGSNLEVIKDNGTGTGTTTWVKDKEYLLDGLVFVNDGQVLTIEPGTVIRGKTGQGEYASALIVAQGGKIEAKGTREEPIIFTCEGDDLEGSVNVKARGLWGGVILLGYARLNTLTGENSIEGIPLYEPRGVYGGEYDSDNSGILEYVSIRHGGTSLGEGNEINGLTLGGVGYGTTINHIEVISNQDDGVEIFGGAVRLKHIAVSFCGDDAFDFDEGYHGFCQFLIGIQDKASGDMLAEHDGGTEPETGNPYSIPVIYNATYIGGGRLADQNTIGFQDNGAGKYMNSVFVHQSRGVVLEYKDGKQNSYNQYQRGNIEFISNLFYNVHYNDLDSIPLVLKNQVELMPAETSALQVYMKSQLNKVENTGIGPDGDLYKITPDYPLTDSLADYPDDWFDKVGYKGAIGTTLKWTSGWTLLDSEGFVY